MNTEKRKTYLLVSVIIWILAAIACLIAFIINKNLLFLLCVGLDIIAAVFNYKDYTKIK